MPRCPCACDTDALCRIDELESMMEYAVDVGWADGLVRALSEIASGRRHAEDIARKALERAGLWPPSQLDLFAPDVVSPEECPLH